MIKQTSMFTIHARYPGVKADDEAEDSKAGQVLQPHTCMLQGSEDSSGNCSAAHAGLFEIEVPERPGDGEAGVGAARGGDDAPAALHLHAAAAALHARALALQPRLVVCTPDNARLLDCMLS